MHDVELSAPVVASPRESLRGLLFASWRIGRPSGARAGDRCGACVLLSLNLSPSGARSLGLHPFNLPPASAVAAVAAEEEVNDNAGLRQSQPLNHRSPAPPTRSAVLPHLGADGHRRELLTCRAFAGFPFVPHPGVPGQDSTAHLRWQTLVLRRGTGDTTPISRTSCNSVAHQRSQSVAPRMQSLKSKKDVIEEAWQTKKKCHHIVVVIIVVIVVVLAQRSFVAL